MHDRKVDNCSFSLASLSSTGIVFLFIRFSPIYLELWYFPLLVRDCRATRFPIFQLVLAYAIAYNIQTDSTLAKKTRNIATVSANVRVHTQFYRHSFIL